MTINYEVFAKDPRANEIPNTGVSKLLPPKSEAEWNVLRYELSSFVCEGEYERGLDRILGSYLAHLGKAEQPAVWVSGFFGSGKSHLVRVLEYLWTDRKLPDGASARGLTQVSSPIASHLIELTTAAKRSDVPLWSAAGTLGAGAAEEIELSFLAILYQASGLPTKIGPARCALWLKSEGIYGAVSDSLADQGREIDSELRNLYVSRPLAEAILAHKPEQAADARELLRQIRESFPDKVSLTVDELVDQVREVLQTVSGQKGVIPLTLVVLDELQQYINDDAGKALRVQHLVEACSSRFDAKLLIVATGQSAMTGNQILQKIVDRFSVQIELKTQDVDTVVRRVVLKKNPSRIGDIQAALNEASGEISRELAGAKIQHRESDNASLVPDYPLLPSRRQFWTEVLRNADTSGKGGQLRSQLRLINEANQHVADKPLGTVVGADYIYEANSGSMQSSGVLLRDTQSLIEDERRNPEDGPLRARVLATVFLIGLLPDTGFQDTGVRPTADHIADLLVEDLSASGSWLRKDVPQILASLVEEGKLQEISGEYRIQTPEGQEWDQDYRARKAGLIGDASRMSMLRQDALTDGASAMIPSKVMQGNTKAARTLAVSLGELPTPVAEAIPVGVVTGWTMTEKQFHDELKAMGSESAVVGVYLPQISPDDFRDALSTYHAAKETVEVRPQPSTDEGRQARRSIESVRDAAKARLKALVNEVVSSASVVQAGGVVADGVNLKTKVEVASLRAADRMYPGFTQADNREWAKVTERARSGNTSPLEAIGHTGETNRQAVAKLVLESLNSTWTSGSAIVSKFSQTPFGWTKDPIHGALLALLVSGDIRAQVGGKETQAKDLRSTDIGAASYLREAVSVGVQERLAARKTLQAAGITCASGEEAAKGALLVERLTARAGTLSGEAPLPQIAMPAALEDLGRLNGNELVAALATSLETVEDFVQSLAVLESRLRDRKANWALAARLSRHASSLEDGSAHEEELEGIRQSRTLLDEQDPVGPVIGGLTQKLRVGLNQAYAEYAAEFDLQTSVLEADPTWQSLDEDTKRSILARSQLLRLPAPSVATPQEVADELDSASLGSWQDRTAALTGRFSAARTEAVKVLTPHAKKVAVPPATMSSPADVDAYLEQLRLFLLGELGSHSSIVI